MRAEELGQAIFKVSQNAARAAEIIKPGQFGEIIVEPKNKVGIFAESLRPPFVPGRVKRGSFTGNVPGDCIRQTARLRHGF